MSESTLSLREEIEQLALDQITRAFDGVDLDVPGFGGRGFASVATRQAEDRQYLTRSMGIVVPLLRGASAPVMVPIGSESRDLRQWYLERYSRILDPSHPGFVGFPDKPMDQKIVELAMEFFYLAQAPELFWNDLPKVCRQAVEKMADLALEHFTLSINNWNLFPIVAQAGLKRLGLGWDRGAVDSLLAEIELMYRGDGWYADGYHRQFDYYVPWEMQAFGLLAANWLADERPALWEQACERARRFALSYDLYFDREGRHIPYGRSMAYRYSAATFWGMAAWLDVPGLDRGRMLRRTHANLTAMGRMSRGMGMADLGFTYHQPLLPEPYLAAGSALGSNAFQILAIPPDDPSWAEAAAMPAFTEDQERREPVPNLLLSRTSGARQAILYNQGSMHPFDFGNHPAKYAKFAYSSHFGFNLASPAFPSLDNMISVSRDELLWSHRFHFQPLPPCNDWLLSRHRPFPESDEVEITTALAVQGSWQVRVHLLTLRGGKRGERDEGIMAGAAGQGGKEDLLTLREGGFSIDTSTREECTTEFPERVSPRPQILIRGRNGVSGLVGLAGEWTPEPSGTFPNMNLYSRYAMVPLLRMKVGAAEGEKTLAVAIYQSPDPEAPESEFLHSPVLESVLDQDGASIPALGRMEAGPAWRVRWPDGSLSGELVFGVLPPFELPGTRGKNWSRSQK